METLRVLTAAEQVAEYLRRALSNGAWGGRVPGGNQLAGILGVGRNTVEAALQQLENEGLLSAQGAGKRRVFKPSGKESRPSLRVALLHLDPPAVAMAEGYLTDLLHRLGEGGHSVFFSEKCLQELGLDAGRVARIVRKTEADAWIICGGSREVLRWFASQPIPSFALFGRRGGLPIAGVGPDHVSACVAATRRMMELGHRRIVQMVRRVRRLPAPGAVELAILNELSSKGVQTGSYNLPDWEETSEGFHGCLAGLFQLTPPTALIIDEAPFLIAAMQFLGRRGLRVPENVSLLCTDADPAFMWCQPTVSHIRWDSRPLVRRVVQWADHVSRGMDDRKQTLTPAEFVEGGTIGPI